VNGLKIEMMQGAVKKAFQRTQKVGNIEADPDLALYGTLKAGHFQELMKVYGEGPIVDYIKLMETKKIMNSGGKR